jgi:hypothetical protein
MAGLHEQTRTADRQDPELAELQSGARAPRLAGDPVRYRHDPAGRANWQARAAARLQGVALQTRPAAKVLFAGRCGRRPGSSSASGA